LKNHKWLLSEKILTKGKIMKNIAVIGAGTMGHSLAQVFAQGGYRVSLHDLSEKGLDRAKQFIAANLETLSKAGLFDPKEKDTIIAKRIDYTTDLSEAVGASDLVIEAVFEDREVKKKLFSDLDRLAPPGAILASNTSYLNIFEFVETGRPDKVIITHWFTPPHIVPLVEIVQGPETSAETVTAVKDVLERLGKETIVLKKFLPGFIGNRLQAALSLETYFLIDNDYATPEDIDKAAKASFGLRMPIVGLVKRSDFAGLDLIQQILRNKSYHPPEVRGKCDQIDKLVGQGNLGVKTRKGFYDYGDQSVEDIVSERDVKLLKLRKLLKELGELG
jgi:3-hydroxybutyryl-CoA dehydrogenase